LQKQSARSHTVEETQMSTSVHLVGSVGLDTVPEVFGSTGRILKDSIKRIPDGEPGGRRCWISWQYPLLRASPFLQVAEQDAPRASAGFAKLRLGDGVTAQTLRFGELGYAREARASYQDFLRARERGEISRSVRFQVCLPTPFAVVVAFCAPNAVSEIEPAYEDAMIRELKSIFEEIPHQDLCLQWDVCVEMVIWDGQIKYHGSFEASEEAIIARLARISATVPSGVELGFHLCYGDWEAKHFVEPKDGERMVSLANALAKAVKHPVAYVHMPVPIARDDDAFFAPFKNLALPKGTEIFLGLVHGSDGVSGAMRRASAAKKFVKEFGVAAECGLSRCKTPEHVIDLLKIHAETARQLETI
jgi:hypothetical protein